MSTWKEVTFGSVVALCIAGVLCVFCGTCASIERTKNEKCVAALRDASVPETAKVALVASGACKSVQ